ncbi:helix-turn-helix transcriptional regulator [Alicyclobacillus sp.]|uniref:helix-turn-helix domain-containing protein n=1 Tax=Alicyclobacillus sp. TaxID=61169 RepID=UPI0025C0B03E|nr:helix-turn-helix transcriptional regulator [Alicyclobacillus sp.]MCL6517657.1 helix-turn-helix domain-containing protein [Alicyclobacillus sp.]
MPNGSRIAELRKGLGMTQAQLASATGLSASTIAMYETNRRTPDPEQLAKLAHALGVSPADLAPEGDASAATPDPDRVNESTAPPAAPARRRASAKAPSTPRPAAKTLRTARRVESGETVAEAVPPDPNAGAVANETGGATPVEAPARPPADPSHAGPPGTLPSASGRPAAGAAPAGASSYPAIPLDKFEARLILFLRMNPQARAFLEAYIAADERRRQQIHKTWRLIHELQR